jgi:hypothetical protein
VPFAALPIVSAIPHDPSLVDARALFCSVESVSTTAVTVRSWVTVAAVTAGQPPITPSGAGTWIYVMATNATP